MINNVTKLRASLIELYDQLLKDEIDLNKANRLTNCAGKIIGTVRIEMEYAHLTDITPDIKFMKKDKED